MTGLAANTPFTAYFHGTNGPFAAEGRQTTFQLTNSDYTLAGALAFTLNSQSDTFATPDNYVTLSGVTDANGGIYAAYQGGAPGNHGGNHGEEGDLNGAQFVVGTPLASAAPEPAQAASLVFVVFGIGGLLVAKKRRTSQACA